MQGNHWNADKIREAMASDDLDVHYEQMREAARLLFSTLPASARRFYEER